VEGPRIAIADTFSRLMCSNVSSPLVRKKAANVVSNSESNNRNESSHSLLMEDRDCPNPFAGFAKHWPCILNEGKVQNL
jgi:hypothetical protein